MGRELADYLRGLRGVGGRGRIRVRTSRTGQSSDSSDQEDIRKGCCCCLLIVLSLIIFSFLYVYLKPTNPALPICSIQKLYIPFLDKISSSNSTNNNHAIYFDLKLRNMEKMNGLIYDPFNLTFSYAAIFPNQSTVYYSFPGFYQGFGKTAHRRGLVETYLVAEGRRSLVEEKDVKGFIVLLGVLRIELATSVRFKNIFGKSKRHKLGLAAKVEINDDGQMVNKKGIKLSGAPLATIFGCYVVLLIAFSCAFSLALL